MGAWGLGPFDSDASLDYLDGLCDRFATVDDDAQIVAGSVDHKAVAAQIRTALLAVTSLGEDDDVWDTCVDGYTAAGLVAAARDESLSQESSGTSLLPNIHASLSGEEVSDTVGLANHCGHVALLTRQDADDLVAEARDTVRALRGLPAFAEPWTRPIEPVLAQLADALER